MVFSTIVENVKSFFQKEEELEQKPDQPKEAAIELFERPISKEEGHRIVAHSLRQQPAPQPAQPKLPYSSEELRQRLKEAEPGPVSGRNAAHGAAGPIATNSQAVSRAQGQSAVSRAQGRSAVSSAQYTEEDISSQIAEFEQAISSIPGEDGSSLPISASEPKAPKHRLQQVRKCYFHEPALRNQGLSPEEMLARMKEHHAANLARERHEMKASSLEHEFTHAVAELQGLERDWAAKQEEIETAKERMAELEAEIVRRSGELQEVAAKLKEHGERAPSPVPVASPSQAPPSPAPATPSPVEPLGPPPLPETGHPAQAPIGSGQRFFLSDGQALSSLGELKEALLRMDDRVFYSHVTPERNDFADWVAGVFLEEGLAAKIRSARSKYELAALL